MNCSPYSTRGRSDFHSNTNHTKAMGDKSPKSKQKSQSQKQTKTAAAEQAKQRQIASKAEVRVTPPAKKK